jgi:hypothetical protein
MTAAAIAASSAREMVLVIPMHAFWVYIVENVSEGGIRLIRNLALLHSFGGCHHQCRSNPANCLPYGQLRVRFWLELFWGALSTISIALYQQYISSCCPALERTPLNATTMFEVFEAHILLVSTF